MENFIQLRKTILDAIKQAETILIVSHRQPDGDALGASLAMAHYLKSLNKTFFCFNEHTPHYYFSYLPGLEQISNDLNEIIKIDFDLMIILDSGDLRRAGIHEHLPKFKNKLTIINIDHHDSNEAFGNYNLIIPEATATCEIIHDLLEEQYITKEIATCLLTGLITDTNGFTNNATTPKAINNASKLLLKGANLKQIVDYTLNHRPLNALKLWGRALERLQEDKDTGIVMTMITLNDLSECQVDESARDGVANFLNSLDHKQAPAIMVFTEQPGEKIKVSLRSINPLLNVAKFAKLMGGGGHAKAAGYELSGRLVQTNQGWKII